jgi:hypothetical protein
MPSAMRERGKEQDVDGLRRLAELLRQAHSAANGAANDKKPAEVKKLRRRGKTDAPATGPGARSKS